MLDFVFLFLVYSLARVGKLQSILPSSPFFLHLHTVFVNGNLYIFRLQLTIVQSITHLSQEIDGT